MLHVFLTKSCLRVFDPQSFTRHSPCQHYLFGQNCVTVHVTFWSRFLFLYPKGCELQSCPVALSIAFIKCGCVEVPGVVDDDKEVEWIFPESWVGKNGGAILS